jgi:hypothetical protein
MSEEVTVNDIAALLEVSRKSAIQRMSRLVKKNQAIKLNMPTVGNPARFKLLVPKESLLHTQKFAGPKMNREIDWKKFCSDPFRLTKEAPEWSATTARKKPRLKRQEFYLRTLDGPSVAEFASTVALRCGLSRCPQKMLLWGRRNESNV